MLVQNFSFMWECQAGKLTFIISTFIYIEETEKQFYNCCHYGPITLISDVVKMCRLPIQQ